MDKLYVSLRINASRFLMPIFFSHTNPSAYFTPIRFPNILAWMASQALGRDRCAAAGARAGDNDHSGLRRWGDPDGRRGREKGSRAFRSHKLPACGLSATGPRKWRESPRRPADHKLAACGYRRVRRLTPCRAPGPRPSSRGRAARAAGSGPGPARRSHPASIRASARSGIRSNARSS